MSYQPGDINNDGNPGTVVDLVKLMTQINFLEHNETNSIARTNDLNQKDIDYLAKHIVGMSGYDLPSGGMFIQNTTNGNIGIGHGSIVQHSDVNVNTVNSIAIGNNSQSVYDNSIAIGTNVVTTEANQIVIGDANSNIVLNGTNNFNNIISSELNVHGDISGNTANLTGLNVDGDISGNTANLTGLNVDGDISGNTANLTGLNVDGDISGNIANLTGLNVDGDISGNIANLTGLNVDGDISGNIANLTGLNVDGNVGIGALIPLGQLHLSNTEDESKIIIERDPDQDYIGTGMSVGGIHFRSADYSWDSQKTGASIEAFVGDINYSGSCHDIRFRTLASPESTNLSNRMTIKYNGNVGIGTDSPNCKLEIPVDGANGLAVSRSDVKMVLGTDTQNATNNGLIQVYRNVTDATPTSSPDTYKLSLNPYGGNVGIGTTDPKSALQVYNDSGMTISPATNSGERTAVLRLGQPYESNHDAYCAKITSTNNHTNDFKSDLRFYTSIGNNASATERMCILSNGNVGIGTDNPDANLHIYGDSTVTELFLG